MPQKVYQSLLPIQKRRQNTDWILTVLKELAGSARLGF
jgi:hypothetical protein